MASQRYALDPGFRAMLTDLGLSPAAVLRAAGLPVDLLTGGPVWLDQQQFFGLWNAVEAAAADPNLPLRLEEAFAPEVFGAAIFAAIMSPDLNVAARRIATYKKLIGPMRLVVDTTADTTSITYEWPADADPPANLILSELVFWVQLARTGTRHRVEPLEVSAPQPPADQDAYEAFLGVPVRRAERQRVVFAAVDAARPFLTANEAIWEAFEPDLRRRLADLEADATTAERVHAVLLELLPAGRTTMSDVAAELAMSGRTLHRRLRDEGTSFQRVLDHTRERLARHYLADAGRSAAEIAFLLGYEETTSFYRAFHNWTGETPEAVRHELIGSSIA